MSSRLAIAAATKAIEADKANDAATACEWYTAAVRHFSRALNEEKSPKLKQMLQTKIDEYTHRLTVLGGPATPSPTTVLQPSTMTTKINWDDVVGLSSAKQALDEAIGFPRKFPKLFTGKRQPWRAILLYGPPGTGKTFLAKAVASTMQTAFYSVSSADLISKYVGESEQQVRQLFTTARANIPSIIFIDEIDALCAHRSETESDTSNRVKTEFLVQMDGVTNDQHGVLVMAATNLPWTLDSAVRRRFEKRMYIALPDTNARAEMMRKGLSGIPHTLNDQEVTLLAEETEGYSGSDIATVIHDAMMQPLRRIHSATCFIKTPEGTFAPCDADTHGALAMTWDTIPSDEIHEAPVTFDDVRQAMQTNGPSIHNADMAQFTEFTSRYGQDG